LHPLKLDSEDSDYESSGEDKEASLKALEHYNNLAKIFSQIGVTVASAGKTAYLWTVNSSGEYNKVQCERDGKLSGPGKDLGKTLATVTTSSLFLQTILSAAKDGKKIPFSDYSAYAPFWSDRPKKTNPINFQDLECYSTEIDIHGKTWKGMFLVDPSQIQPCGVIAKPIVEDPDGRIEVKVFIFSEFKVEEGSGVPEQRAPSLEIDVQEFINRRARYLI